MANNRMFMLHRPSLIAFPLAKRFTTQWAPAQEVERKELAYFFELCSVIGLSPDDDFLIITEDSPNYEYSGEDYFGFPIFQVKEPKKPPVLTHILDLEIKSMPNQEGDPNCNHDWVTFGDGEGDPPSGRRCQTCRRQEWY